MRLRGRCATVTVKRGDESQRERARIFGRRLAEKAVELFG